MDKRPGNARPVNWGPATDMIAKIIKDEEELVRRGILPRHDNITITSGGEKLVVIVTNQDN